MKKLRVICDMDSVIARIDEKWYGLANAEYGCNVSMADITNWETSKFFPCGKSIYKYLSRPGFFRDLPVIDGALEGLKAIQDAGHEVLVLSACSSPEGKKDKTLWLNEKFPFLKGRLLINDTNVPKDVVVGDVLIDDGPHNILAYRATHPNSYIVTFSYPYNQHAHKAASLVAGDYTNFRQAWANATEAVINLGKTLNQEG